jgi:hypothetical protein
MNLERIPSLVDEFSPKRFFDVSYQTIICIWEMISSHPVDVKRFFEDDRYRFSILRVYI